MNSSLRIKTTVGKEENGGEEEMEPVTPTGQYLSSSVFSSRILAVIESEISILEDFVSPKAVGEVLLSFSPRFSSIMIKDKNGTSKEWKKVEVNVEDHIKIPEFPPGLSIESYDKHFDNYLSQISMEEFAEDRPLWEFHIFKYPTSHAPGAFIAKIHHALGDGYSLIGAILTTFKRADDPSKPLTFPVTKAPSTTESRRNNPARNFFSLICQIFFAAWYGLLDLIICMCAIYVADDRTPIRSGDVAVQYKPSRISTISFSLDKMKQIKTKLGVTINDVVVGTILLATNLYNEQMSPGLMKGKCSTVVVPVNIRAAKGYKPVEDMNKRQSKTPWGNRVSAVLIPIPNHSDNVKSVNPLDFIFGAQETIRRRRTSFGVLFFGLMLDIVRRCAGVEVAANYFYRMFKNTSLTITNLAGPMDKMAVANHPVKGIYFTVAGAPQSLMVSVLSYMQTLRIALGVEDGYIDRQRLVQCVENAFELISRAAMQNNEIS